MCVHNYSPKLFRQKQEVAPCRAKPLYQPRTAGTAGTLGHSAVVKITVTQYEHLKFQHAASLYSDVHFTLWI